MSSIQPAPSPEPRDGTPKGEHVMVPIDRILVPDGRRPPRNIAELAASIAELGLLNPITLTPDYRLIAGRNRHAACLALGWTHIPSIVVAIDGLRAELAEIDENLIRDELPALERSEALARRKAIYEALHPETRHVTERGGPGRGRRKGRKTGADSASVFPPGLVEQVETPTPPFTADTAARTGRSRRTVQTEVQIAERIPEGLRDQIRGTPLADRKDDLLKLAQLDHGRQGAVVTRVLADPKLTIPQAIGRVRHAAEVAELDAKALALANAPGDGTGNLWEIREGVDVAVMATIEPGSVRLVFADPPYNQNVDYGEHYDDNLPPEIYLAQCRACFEAAARVLTEDGTLCVLTSPRWGGRTQCLLEDLGLHYRETIIWNEAFGVHCERTFGKDHRPLYRFTKHPKRQVFHPERVPSARQTTHGDRRANPAGRVPSNVWRFPRVCGTHAERQPGFPTQLPLDLMRRIIRTMSDPGDLVLDTFSGSGTTGVAAIELDRRFIGIEQSPEFARRSRVRLSDTKRMASASTTLRS